MVERVIDVDDVGDSNSSPPTGKLLMNTVLNWINGLGIVAILTVLLNQYLQHNSETQAKLRESKEAQYKSLLTNLLGFFEGWEDYEIPGDDKKKRKRQFMWEVYTSAAVYASDDVLKLCYKFIESHSKVDKQS